MMPTGARTPAAKGMAAALYPVAQKRFCTVFLKVSRESRIRFNTSRGLERTRTMSAVSAATSVPAPMAMPRSAVARAGASFTPSPVMATRSPLSCSSLTLSALRSGGTSAKNSSRPSSSATEAATRLLSPVSIITLIPSFLRREMVSLDSSRITSERATAPRGRSSAMTKTTVLPASESRSTRSRSNCKPFSSAYPGLTTIILRP